MMRDRVTLNKGVIQNVPLDSLEKLFYIFDELACHHEYSRDDGELHIGIGESFWLSFYADPAELREIEAEKYWLDDAERVAEGYWNE
jgi:hypothetical protein